MLVLIGIVGGEIDDSFDVFLVIGPSFLVRIEKHLVAGDDEAALAGFGLGDRGDELLEAGEDLVRVCDPIGGVLQLVRLVHRQDRVQHDQDPEHANRQEYASLPERWHVILIPCDAVDS